MKEMNKVIVKINGSEYPMVGPKSEEHMLRAARYVDQEIRKITTANPKLSTSSASILSAINIADVFFECCDENEELLKENEELVSHQISSIREFLIPLLEKDKELKSCILDDNVTLEFIENTKFRLLWLAINEMFKTRSFDIKQNILNLLNSSDKMQRILKERIKVTFSSITDWRYDDELGKFL